MMELKAAIIQTWDPGTYTAGVQIVGSLPVYLTVTVVRNIASAEMIAGRSGLVAVDTGLADAVLIAVHT